MLNTGDLGASLRLSPDAFGPERPKIQNMSGPSASQQIESAWKRPLHATGTGANHVRTFTGKLTPNGLEYLDKHINEWLDTHPDAEVKFSSITVGEVSTAVGKEHTLVVQVWI